jgi:PAS domain S-box-containing protein
MKEDNTNSPESTSPSKKSKEQVNKQQTTSVKKADMLKLIHELQRHQIELELQNEELRISRNEVEAAAQKYTELYDFAPTGYFSLSKEYNILELNFAGAQLLRKDRSFLINKNFSLFISDNFRLVFDSFFMSIFENSGKKTCDMGFTSDENAPIQVQLSGIATSSTQCLISAVDITDRLHGAELLAISETRYRRLFETAKDGILILNAESGMIEDVNPFLIEMLGYSRDQFLGKRLWDVGFFKDVLANKLNFSELQEKGYVRYEDMPLETASGESKDVEFVSNIYLVNNYKVIQCNIRDITERKKAIEATKKYVQELTYANETKDKFFSIIAHDLRSPFHGLLNLTEIMTNESEKFTISEFLDASKSLHTSVKNLYQLLSNLLEWAQMQKGTIRFAPSELSLHPLVTQSILSVNQIAEQKSIAIVNEVFETLKIYADEHMLYTVLRNLISNAVKFTRKDGKVIIKSSMDITEMMVNISVSDTGIGISDEDMQQLFRIEGGMKSKGTSGEPGTGLGLVLCKEFVEKHGGKIWALSEVGKGSTFYFTIGKQSIEA